MNGLLPFNITLLDPARGRLGALLPVTTADIYDNEGDYHPQGLYSSQIFAKPGDHLRQVRHGYIDMHTRIFHPKVFLELSRIKALYKKILSGKGYATWNAKLKDFETSDILDGETGYAFFMSHFDEMVFVRNQSPARDLRIDLLEKYRGKCMVRYLVVLPAGLRDIEIDAAGRTIENDLNPLYRKVIRTANTLSADGSDKNDPTLDTARWSLQQHFNAVYEHIEGILKGKNGFLLAKWGSRKIHHGTRNVLTALDPAPPVLGGTNAPGVNDTIVGLYQYLKGTMDLAIFAVKTGPLAPIISALPGNISVIDPKTLKSKTVNPSTFVRDKWGSDNSIEELISGYEKLAARHKPVMMDGGYVALIYRDDKNFRVIYDIDEVPEGWDRDKVTPMTWTELYYICAMSYYEKTIAFITRYPITGDGSIYPSEVSVKTTNVGIALRALNVDWLAEDGDAGLLINMPVPGGAFFESMSVHTSKIKGLGADFDGDMTSCNIVVHKEAVDEGKAYMKSAKAFLSPSGGLNYGVVGDIGELVLHNFTNTEKIKAILKG